MKKFTKKLALMLVLAMLVGLLSGAMTASAADWTFNAGNNNCTIYLAKGGYYDLNALFQGENAEKMTSVYSVKYESSNTDVVFVREDTGKMRADKEGKMATATGDAVITVSILNLTKTNAKVYTRTVNVKVGYAPATVEISNKDVVAETLAIGTEYDLDSKMLAADGTAVKKGAYRGWFCEGIDINLTSGKFTPAKAGEYTITVGLFNSAADRTAGLTKAIATDTVTVNVASDAAEFVSAELSATNTAVITLSAPITAAEASAITMSRIVSGKAVDVSSLIKSATLSKDGTVITLVSYGDFVNKTSYVFGLANVEEDYTMVASIGEAVAVRFSKPTTNTGVINSAIEIAVKYVDANGLEVAKPAGTLAITASSSSYGYYDSTSQKLYIYKAGEAITLKASFTLTTYNTTDFTFNTLEGDTMTVVGTEKPTVSYTETYEYTVGKTAETPDWSKKAVKLASDVTNYSLFFRAKLTDDTYKDTGFTYQVLNSGIIFINSATGAITPLATGIANVLVSDSNGYVQVVTIAVQAASKNVDISVLPSGSTSASNAVGLDGNVVYTVKYVDQYNEQSDVLAGGMTVEIAGSGTFGGANVDTTADGKITFNTEGIAKGTYNFKVTVGKFTKYVSVTVTEPDSNVVAYKVVVDSTSSDVAIKKDSTIAGYAIGYKVVGIDKNGSDVCIVNTEDTFKIGGAAATAGAIVVTLKTGDTVVSDESVNEFIATTGVGTFSPVYEKEGAATTIDGAKVLKLAAGSYVLSAKVTVNGVTRDAIPAVINVSDSGVAPVITLANAALAISKSKTSVDNVEKLVAYIADTSKNVITLPTAVDAYTLAVTGITHATAINDGTGFVSGDFLIKNITVTKTYKGTTTVEVFTITFNRTVSVTITD